MARDRHQDIRALRRGHTRRLARALRGAWTPPAALAVIAAPGFSLAGSQVGARASLALAGAWLAGHVVFHSAADQWESDELD